jgi:alpha-galactosidase
MRSKLFLLSMCVALYAFFPIQGFAQTDDVIPLKEGWRFVPGDSPIYADPQLDHSQWKQIRTDKTWEEQGYETLDRFAWYRIRVVFPYSMRVHSYLKDSLRIFLGKINNFDQTFLNGRLIGINGQTVSPTTPVDTSFLKADQGLWNADRRYVLSFDDPRIRWDNDNVIAVRVFDAGGQGGMWSGGQVVSMTQLQDYVNIDYREKQFRFGGTC